MPLHARRESFESGGAGAAIETEPESQDGGVGSPRQDQARGGADGESSQPAQIRPGDECARAAAGARSAFAIRRGPAAQTKSAPPSTVSVCPVVELPASDAKKRMASAISRG